MSSQSERIEAALSRDKAWRVTDEARSTDGFEVYLDGNKIWRLSSTREPFTGTIVYAGTQRAIVNGDVTGSYRPRTEPQTFADAAAPASEVLLNAGQQAAVARGEALVSEVPDLPPRRGQRAAKRGRSRTVIEEPGAAVADEVVATALSVGGESVHVGTDEVWRLSSTLQPFTGVIVAPGQANMRIDIQNGAPKDIYRAGPPASDDAVLEDNQPVSELDDDGLSDERRAVAEQAWRAASGLRAEHERLRGMWYNGRWPDQIGIYAAEMDNTIRRLEQISVDSADEDKDLNEVRERFKETFEIFASVPRPAAIKSFADAAANVVGGAARGAADVVEEVADQAAGLAEGVARAGARAVDAVAGGDAQRERIAGQLTDRALQAARDLRSLDEEVRNRLRNSTREERNTDEFQTWQARASASRRQYAKEIKNWKEFTNQTRVSFAEPAYWPPPGSTERAAGAEAWYANAGPWFANAGGKDQWGNNPEAARRAAARATGVPAAQRVTFADARAEMAAGSAELAARPAPRSFADAAAPAAAPSGGSEMERARAKYFAHYGPGGSKRDLASTAKRVVTTADKYHPNRNDFQGLDTKGGSATFADASSSGSELDRARAKYLAHYGPGGSKRDVGRTAKKVVTTADKYHPARNDFRGLDTKGGSGPVAAAAAAAPAKKKTAKKKTAAKKKKAAPKKKAVAKKAVAKKAAPKKKKAAAKKKGKTISFTTKSGKKVSFVAG